MSLQGTGVPYSHPLLVVQGDSFAVIFTLQDEDGDPISLAGLDGRAQVRDEYGGTLLMTLTVSVDTSTSGDSVGYVTVSASPSDTDSNYRGVWDLELIDTAVSPTFRRTVVSGPYATIPQVTE
jgi:hypothetical protein